jgi:FkbM family methyltransferase
MNIKIVTFFLSLFDYINKKKVINFFKKNLNNKIENFIDVGAHHAETVKLFNKSFLIENFFCFEPNPSTFEVLKKKIKKIKNNSINIYNFALGEINGYLNFNQSIESNSSTLVDINNQSKYLIRKNNILNFFKSNDNVFNKIQVKVKTLKEFIEEKSINKIEILKIDTEGYDFNVIKGLEQKIKNVQYIYFEHHFHDMLKKSYHLSDVHNYLKNNHFKKVFKIKMFFRKTFEYIYYNEKY